MNIFDIVFFHHFYYDFYHKNYSNFQYYIHITCFLNVSLNLLQNSQNREILLFFNDQRNKHILESLRKIQMLFTKSIQTFLIKIPNQSNMFLLNSMNTMKKLSLMLTMKSLIILNMTSNCRDKFGRQSTI